MEKSLFEQLSGTYRRENGYLIPNLKLPTAGEQPIGLYGQRHLQYLKQYHKGTYITLLTRGKLNAYLADIDRQAQVRIERLMKDMKQAQSITEQLKDENPIEWIGRVKNI